MACDNCAKANSDDDIITCQELCTLPFHFKCAGLTAAHIKAKTENKNLIWVCEECLKVLKNAVFRRTAGTYESVVKNIRDMQANALTEVKEELAKANKKLDKLSNSRLNFASPRIATNWPEVSSQSTKRRRVENVTQAPSIGTKKSTFKTIATVPPPEKKIWIYLGRLQNCVTTTDIEELVKECLQCETAEAHLLVRKDADLSQLKAVSFKVGVDLQLKDTALSASTWPAGVFFREFQDMGAKNSTNPVGVNLSTPNRPTTRSTTILLD